MRFVWIPGMTIQEYHAEKAQAVYMFTALSLIYVIALLCKRNRTKEDNQNLITIAIIEGALLLLSFILLLMGV